MDELINLEYVIYCRKSTDETSEHQKQSIPDQIKSCIEYAKREGLHIKEKTKDFSVFESELEIYKEDNEVDLVNRKLFKDTRNLFIIKEQETAKTPYKRPKWRTLMKMIDKGKIKGIISYSPDRQARNILEGGELINYVDEGKVDLRYTNFHFENNASGKMMLGIWFVFSKQYSDKLSEDITRGNKSKVNSGKAIGRYKHGYIINEYGFHEPHPENFNLIKEAFQMKLDGVVESKIREFLSANGYFREMKKTGEKKEIGKNAINELFRDSFYYGMFVNGETITDLRITNSYYKPIITEEEFQIIQDRYYQNPIVLTKKSKIKDIYEDIRPFENDFFITEDNYGMTFSVPNINRFQKKIDKANEEGKKLELKDVIKPHQILYRCTVPNSKLHNVNLTLEDIDKEILKSLDNFKVGEKEFQEYVKYTNNQLDKITLTTTEKISSKTLEIGRLKTEKKKYMQNNMHIKKDKEEIEIYENHKKSFDDKVAFLIKELNALEEGERNEIVELEIFIDMLNNAKDYYKRANYVQRGKIAKILFLNIKLNANKRLQIQVKPGLETLFNPGWYF